MKQFLFLKDDHGSHIIGYITESPVVTTKPSEHPRHLSHVVAAGRIGMMIANILQWEIRDEAGVTIAHSNLDQPAGFMNSSHLADDLIIRVAIQEQQHIIKKMRKKLGDSTWKGLFRSR